MMQYGASKIEKDIRQQDKSESGKMIKVNVQLLLHEIGNRAIMRPSLPPEGQASGGNQNINL
jgi:hypothetical protein